MQMNSNFDKLSTEQTEICGPMWGPMQLDVAQQCGPTDLTVYNGYFERS